MGHGRSNVLQLYCVLIAKLVRDLLIDLPCAYDGLKLEKNKSKVICVDLELEKPITL
jgi:hypothetical protein